MDWIYSKLTLGIFLSIPNNLSRIIEVFYEALYFWSCRSQIWLDLPMNLGLCLLHYKMLCFNYQDKLYINPHIISIDGESTLIPQNILFCYLQTNKLLSIFIIKYNICEHHIVVDVNFMKINVTWFMIISKLTKKSRGNYQNCLRYW